MQSRIKNSLDNPKGHIPPTENPRRNTGGRGEAGYYPEDREGVKSSLRLVAKLFSWPRITAAGSRQKPAAFSQSMRLACWRGER